MAKLISIGKKIIGQGEPVFIIAEAGVNHNGKLSFAKRLINAAAKAGADAVKFQTFNPETLVTRSAGKAEYQMRAHHPALLSSRTPTPRGLGISPWKRGSGGGGETQYEMLKRLMLPRAWHPSLKRYAEKKGIVFLSTPFSLDDALFLKKLGVAALKIGSGDANNLPYLRKIARWRIPIILSTGMSNLKEVREAVGAIQNPPPRIRGTSFTKGGIRHNARLILLQCTTNYPTPFAEANLRAMETMRTALGVPVGFSDHTLGYEAACAAVALGARVIEKHLTLARTLPGPDHKASLEPAELADFVRKIRNTEAALGNGRKVPFPSERETAKVARKSVVALRAIKTGERLTGENIGIKRPGTGLPPACLDAIIGRRVTGNIPTDALLTKSDYAD